MRSVLTHSVFKAKQFPNEIFLAIQTEKNKEWDYINLKLNDKNGQINFVNI
jgi:hypothetical protein